jgi:nucleotide-binding universal stress UspA family protein
LRYVIEKNFGLVRLSPSGGAALSATETFDVFFSYNRKDAKAVRAVRDALEARDVRVWMDEHQIDPGDRWMQEIQDIIAIAPAAAIFCGEHGLGAWQEIEFESCYHEHQDRGIPIIPWQ